MLERFWLAVSDFIVHQLEKFILTKFLCVVIIIVFYCTLEIINWQDKKKSFKACLYNDLNYNYTDYYKNFIMKSTPTDDKVLFIINIRFMSSVTLNAWALNYIVHLCRYHYTCCVDFNIHKYSERLFKLYH